jgi:hypothetical protein
MISSSIFIFEATLGQEGEEEYRRVLKFFSAISRNSTRDAS